MRSAPIARWAKSWHTPRRAASTVASGVDTSVNDGSYSNCSWMTRHSARAASTIGRPRRERRRGERRAARPIGRRSPTNGDAAGERPHVEGVAAAQLARPPPPRPPTADPIAVEHGSAAPRRPTSPRTREPIVLVVDAELQHTVAEHVAALDALVRLRLDRRRRRDSTVCSGVGAGHHVRPACSRRSSAASTRTSSGARRGSRRLAHARRGAPGPHQHRLHGRGEPRSSTTSAANAATAAADGVEVRRPTRARRPDASRHDGDELADRLPSRRTSRRRRRARRARSRHATIRPRVVAVAEQQLERRRQLDVAAVLPAVGDEALVGRQQHLQRRRHAAVSCPSAAASASPISEPARPSTTSARSRRTPMSPKRHAGPRTVDSFHIPANAASVGQHVVDARRRRRGRRRTTRIDAATSASTRAVLAGQELADRRGLGDERPQPLAELRASPPASRVELEHGRRARRRRRRRRGDAADGAAAPRPSATPTARRRTSTSVGSWRRRPATTRSVLAIASARSAARPIQNSASAARVGTERGEVDLRQRRDDGRRATASASSTQTSLTSACRRPPRVVARRQHPAVAAGHHRDAVRRRRRRAGGRTTAGVAELAVAERRQRLQLRPSVPASPSCGRRSDDPVSASAAAGQNGASGGVLEHARSRGRWRGRRHRSATADSSPGTPRRAGARQLDRVGLVVVDAAVHDVDRVEPAERAQPQPALAHDEVGSLDEREPEQPGERRVLDVAGVLDAAAEQHDARAGDGGVGDEGVAQLGRRHRRATRRRRRSAPSSSRRREHRRAVEQGVADPGRRVGEVLHDAPRPVGECDDVDGVRRQPPRRRRRARPSRAGSGSSSSAPRRARRRRRRACAARRGRRGRAPSPRRARRRRRRDRSNVAPSSTSGTGSTRHGRRRPRGDVHLVHEVPGARRGEHPVGLGLAADQRGAVAQAAARAARRATRMRTRRARRAAGSARGSAGRAGRGRPAASPSRRRARRRRCRRPSTSRSDGVDGVDLVEQHAGIGQLAEGPADLPQQRPDGTREAIVLEQEAHDGGPSIGPRTARRYICRPDSDCSTPIHSSSS